MRNIEAELSELLRDEIDGPHGESERRAAAEFVRDAMSGNDYDDPVEAAADLAESLAEACTSLAERIRSRLLGPVLFEETSDDDDVKTTRKIRSLPEWWATATLPQKIKVFVLGGMVNRGHLVCAGDGPDYRAADAAATRAQVTALLPTLPHDALCDGREGKPCDCYKSELARHVEDAAADAARDEAEAGEDGS